MSSSPTRRDSKGEGDLVLDFFNHQGNLPRNDSGASLEELARSPSGASLRLSPSGNSLRSLSRSDSGSSLPTDDTATTMRAPTASAAMVIKIAVAVPKEEPPLLEGKAAQAHPLPLRAVATLCMAQIAHFYSMCSVFSYAGFLAVDLGWVANADRAGYVAGLVAAMLPLGRLPTSVLWGWIADRYGRRPALIGSMAGIAAGNLCFAFARPMWAALAVRFVLLGGANGWNSILGPICAEIGGPRQAQLLGYVFGAGGVINLLGPAIGGFTYGACVPYFPALVPSLIGAVLGVVATLMAWAWLPETRPQLPPVAPAPAPAYAAAARSVTCPDPTLAASKRAAPAPSPASFPAAVSATDDAPPPRAPRGPSLWSMMRAPPMPAVIALRTGIGLAAFASYDVIPLWAIASAGAGGAALPQRSLGGLLAGAAALQLLWTTFCMGPVMMAAGVRRTFVGASVVGALALLALPQTSAWPAYAIAPLVAAQSAALNTGCTASVAMTNHAAAAHPTAVGALNGVVVTVESVAKALGPALGAPLFAAAITARPLAAGWPSGALLSFAGFALLVALHAVGGALMPRRIDAPLGGGDLL